MRFLSFCASLSDSLTFYISLRFRAGLYVLDGASISLFVCLFISLPLYVLDGVPEDGPVVNISVCLSVYLTPKHTRTPSLI